MFSIKTVKTYHNTKQIKESVIEVPNYNISKSSCGRIEVTFPFDDKIGYSMIRSSKFENTKNGIFEEIIYITNSNGKTIDKLEASDNFDTTKSKDED